MRTAADWMRRGRAEPHDLGFGVGRDAWALDRWALGQIHRRLDDPAIRLALWDRTSVGPPVGEAAVAVNILDRQALYGLVHDAEMAFGDGYSLGRITVTGDLTHLIEAAYRTAAEYRPHWWRHLPVNTLRRASANVHAHYDLGNDFYRLWLDRELVYTCAYYPRAAMTLEEAQAAKHELVCRKLALEPGMTVVEAGCGWGALARHMARHYGVTVRAYNVSHEQVAFARERAREEGLDGQITFVEDDYRTIHGRFDRFVSVGMLEHVGVAQFAVLGEVIDRVLDPRHGRGFLHFIGRTHAEPLSRWITSRIFPGAYPPTLGEASAGVLEPWRFSVLDVENLRLHYARTLDEWRRRFEAAWDEVVAAYGEPFARAWRLYLVGSRVSFEQGSMQLFQVSFARQGDDQVPWTRQAIYDSPLGAAP